MSWNISIENGQATINLSVEQDAAGRALIAATAAEAAASNAETASTQAGESASESAASATAAGQSATNALSSEQAAASSASQAAGSATAASANATAAGQSATEAESSATAATGSATAAAQSETNAATSATEASQSATESAASATAAGQSATEAAASESVATAQAVIAVTKAGEASQSASEALASAQAAAQSEVDAEAARNEIVSKIDFTGAQEGDIYRVNSAGVAVRINETEFIQGLLLKSPLSGLHNLGDAFAWDSFNRGDGVIGNADSGQPWLDLGQSPFVITQKSITGSSYVDTNIAVIQRPTPVNRTAPYRGATGLKFGMMYRGNASKAIIMKDLANYFYYEITFGFIILGKVIGGVNTTLLTQSINRDVNYSSEVDMKVQRIGEASRLYLTVIDTADGIQRRVDLSSEWANYNPDEWVYVGFMTESPNIAEACYYKNVIMYNL